MKSRAKKLVKDLLIIFFAGLAYYILYRALGIGLSCPTYSISGYLCPLCGATRMLSSLLLLDISSALYYNCALTLLLPLLAAVAASHCYRYIRYDTQDLLTWQRVALIFSVTVLAVFCLLRNIIDLGLTPSPRI